MRNLLTTLFLLFSISLIAQFNYDVSEENPFGKYNPKAPKEIEDYKDLIGECNCTSESRNPDGSWTKPIKMIWRWKYIMNGTAIQDETLKEDGGHSGSIRQYNKDSLNWYVHYYSSKVATPKLRSWAGNKNQKGKIILYMGQKAPNGTDGSSRLTFYDINDKGYKWIGEWVDKTEKIVFPFWKITCVKRED
jgi:hypothetical protein